MAQNRSLFTFQPGKNYPFIELPHRPDGGRNNGRFFSSVQLVRWGKVRKNWGPGIRGGGIFSLSAYKKQRPAPSPPLLSTLLKDFFISKMEYERRSEGVDICCLTAAVADRSWLSYSLYKLTHQKVGLLFDENFPAF